MYEQTLFFAAQTLFFVPDPYAAAIRKMGREGPFCRAAP
jgi:hypothetical protein